MSPSGRSAVVEAPSPLAASLADQDRSWLCDFVSDDSRLSHGRHWHSWPPKGSTVPRDNGSTRRHHKANEAPAAPALSGTALCMVPMSLGGSGDSTGETRVKLAGDGMGDPVSAGDASDARRRAPGDAPKRARGRASTNDW